MNMENESYESPEQKSEKKSGNGSTTSQKIYEQGAEAYGKAEEVVSDAYDKTSEKVSETYEKAKSYGSDNPGKSILIALGIGVGIGFLLGSSTRRRSRGTGRIARPMVNALSDIAMAFWR